MKVLITGHEGLIGSRLYKYYKSKDYDVYGYDLDSDSELFLEDYDIIHHCASLCIIREVISNPIQMLWNIEITFRILELARRCRPSKLFMYSSNRVTANVDNPYVTSKKFLEDAVRGYANCYDLNYVIVRPETIWGYKKNDVRIMSNWIEKALTRKDLVLYGDINKELSPLYVDDFIREVLGLDYNKNIGKTITITGEIMNAYDIAKVIIKELRSESTVVLKDAEIAQPQRAITRGIDEIRLSTNLPEEIIKYQNYKELFGN